MLLLLALLLIRIGAHRVIDASKWYGSLSAAERSIEWNGVIRFERARFVPHGKGQSAAITAERVVIRAGGPLWLMRLALRRAPAASLERLRGELERGGALAQGQVPATIPRVAQLSIDAEGVEYGPDSAPVRWLPWIAPGNGVLFAALGCRELIDLERAVAARAGDSGRLDLHLSLVQEADNAKLGAAFSFGEISKSEWSGEVLVPDDTGLLSTDWRQWLLAAQQWTLRDRDFVRARNRECARRLAVPRPQFVARHALSVKRQLAGWRIALPAPIESAYREHASVGGEIVFESRPSRPITLGEYQVMSRSQRVGALDGQLTVAGRRLPFLLEFLPERAPVPATPEPAESGAETIATGMAPGSTPSTAKTTPALGEPATIAGDAPGTTSRETATGATPTAPSTVTSPTDASMPTATMPTATAPVDVGIPGLEATANPVTFPAPAVAPSPPAAAATTGGTDPAPIRESARLPSQGNYRGLLGKRVTIYTRLGTVRSGRVSVANNVAVTLETTSRAGPIDLRIPVEDIREVR